MKTLQILLFFVLTFMLKALTAKEKQDADLSLKGKHSLAISLVNFNYTTLYNSHYKAAPVFRNYLNNVIYSYGITKKTNFRSSLMFSYKNDGVETQYRFNDEWEKVRFRSGELRVGLERNFGKRRLSGFYGMDARVEYGKSQHEYCYNCGERYFIYRPPYKGESESSKLEIGFVPFVGAKIRLSKHLFLMTELAVSFNRFFEYNENRTRVSNYPMPFTTRLLSVGYTF